MPPRFEYQNLFDSIEVNTGLCCGALIKAERSPLNRRHPANPQPFRKDGAYAAGDQDVARRIGYLPEEPAFYTWMTPSEFLDHVGRVFGLSTSERAVRVKELLDLVGLSEVGKRRIGGFSRGMRQRLGLAQALVNRPEVLFLDEALSGLDPAGRKDILELIKQLSGQCTVFISTHILADIERVCDTIAIIAHGQLVKQAPRDDLLTQYAIPAFEVEIESGFEAPLNDWVKALRKKNWVQSVSISGLKVRIIVHEIQVAKQELMPSAIKAGLVMTRYEMLRPSLEDVFLRLVGEGSRL